MRSPWTHAFRIPCALVLAGACSSDPAANGIDGGAPGADSGRSGADGKAPGDAGTTVYLTLSPLSVAVPEKGTVSFTCIVSGSTNAACTWRVKEAGGGTITSTGVYTAPSAPGTYQVNAASAAEPAVSATATVTVVNQAPAVCSDLPGPGTWSNITPPSLNIAEWCVPYNTGCPQPGMTMDGKMGTYGSNAFVLDPNHPGTVYLGTSSLGIWKSIDCGSTWVHVDTGTNGMVLDAGRNWTMAIDPTNSQVLYTVAGYGQGGLYKSTDGGVNWTQILTQNVLDATGATPCADTADQQVCGGFGGFVEKVTLDPTNNEHLLVGFHSDCAGTTPLPGATVDSAGGWGCLAESMDAGATWTLTTNAVPWSGLDGPGQTMVDAKTWFYGTNGPDGLWRTTTGGVSTDGSPAWTRVLSGSVNGSIYVAKDGTYYVGGGNISWSGDLGMTWTTIPGSPGAGSFNGSTPMVDDGAELFVGSGSASYFTIADSHAPSGPFAMIASPPLVTSMTTYTEGSFAAYLDYDAAHHLVYSSNMDGGFFRYVAAQ